MSTGKVRVEIRPWLSDGLSPNGSGAVVLEEQIEKGATVSGLLTRLAAEHKALGKVLFEPDGRQLNGEVCIVVDGRLLQLPGELDKGLKDGTTITLLPVIDGG
ncbi:MAG: MoaD/ThiS family protein [Chloroflexota bacterium]